MKHPLIPVCAIMLALVLADASSAQGIAPGGSQYNPPLPPPPPPPKIEVPVVPQMDAPVHQNHVSAPRRPSFSDRITTCLDQAAAAGLGPGERELYSRSCANQ
jgi:hypothetical protein